MKRKITPILIASVLFGLLFDLFFYDKAPGISVFLYTVLIVGTVVLLADLFKTKLSKSVYFLLPIILFFAAFTFIRASGMLLFFNVVLIFYLLLLLIRLRLRPDLALKDYTIGQYFSSMISLPFRFFREAGIEMRTVVVAERQPKPSRASYEPVLRGIAIALPIIVVFVLLLSSADLEFQHLVSNIFRLHISINGNFVAQLILAVLVALAFIGAFAIFFMRSTEEVRNEKKLNRFEIGTIESSIVLGSVEVLFLLFLVVQATYFFGGNHHVMTTSFTYAEYARHGFFELITVAVISLLLIWWLKQSTRLHNTTQTNKFKILSIVLIAELMVIMLSAHMRLGLYEQTYGFTRSRLLAHMFIYWMAVAFVLIAIYIIRAEKEHEFAFRLFVAVLAFFAVLNLINPDALIARHNIARLSSTGKIDAYTLTNLSEDATPVLAPLLTSSAVNTSTQTKVSTVMSDWLYEQKVTLQCHDNHWQSANIARMTAEDVLKKNSSLIQSSYTNPPHCEAGQIRY
jgi:hypothetical protein